MTARIVIICFVSAFSFVSALEGDNYNVPIGWGEIDEARKQEFLDLQGEFLARKAGMRLTPEEKTALSQGEESSLPSIAGTETGFCARAFGEGI